MHRTLAAVLFGLLNVASPAGLASHAHHVFNSGAEAQAASIWGCDYSGSVPSIYGDSVTVNGSLGDDMTIEECLGLAQTKVAEMSATWLVKIRQTQIGPGIAECPAPDRYLLCTLGELEQIYEPGAVPGVSPATSVYPYRCGARYYAACTYTFSPGYFLRAPQWSGVVHRAPQDSPGVYHPHDIYIRATPIECPVDDMLPKPTDACSDSLENSGGLRPAPPPICPADQTKSDPNGEPCFKEKMALLGIPYNGPTGTVRTLGYQKHLYDLWVKDKQHKAIIKKGDPAKIAACAEKKKIIDNEINNIHGGLDIPTDGTAPDTHSKGRAFDVSRKTVKDLERRMRLDATDIFTWLFAPPPRSCNLDWGGDFQFGRDPVHFQLPK